MKKAFSVILILCLLTGCKNENQRNRLKGNVNQGNHNTNSVDTFLENPASLAGQEVTISGLVAHVCKHGGQKLFMVGTMPDKYVRINTGKNIAEFPIDLEGSVIDVKGIVTQFENELPEDSEETTNAISESDTSNLEMTYHKDNFYVIVAVSYVVNK